MQLDLRRAHLRIVRICAGPVDPKVFGVVPQCDDGGMDERTFDHGMGGSDAMSDGRLDGRCYDYREMLDELRCHTSESVELVRLEAVAEQRWWHLRELAAMRVLDERGKVD